MNTLSRAVGICRSIFSSRSNRHAVAAILAVLCVAIFVAGALLVQQPHDTTKSRIGERARVQTTGRRHSSSSTNKPSQEVEVQSAGNTPSPVFSVMKSNDVRKKLFDATKPRETDAQLSVENDQASELASRGTSTGEDEAEARERKERVARLTASGAFKSAAQDQIEEASPDTVATTVD